MRARRLLHRIFHGLPALLPALLLASLASHAAAQTDPPSRVGRLNLAEGAIVFSPAGDTEWTDAAPNRPLTQGDRLWTDKGSRAELHAGAIALRMTARTQLAFVALDDRATQLMLAQGGVQARLRDLPEGDSFQLDTPHLSLRAVQAGDLRVDVDPDRGVTRVTVHSGTVMAYGENGQSLAMGGGQQVEFQGRALAQVSAQEAPPLDVFDRWAAERDRLEDQLVSARYVPREVTGFQQLDAWGKWVKDPALGPVWLPRDVDAAWMPFRYGRWDLVAPWGWTWIDEAPWAFATSHYGRWTQLAARWAWVPGRMAARPVYSPALVGFLGSGAVKDPVNPQLGTGRPGVAWFPLAPGEAWKPGYRATPVYLGNVNRNMAAGEPANGGYVHRRAEATTAIALDDFQHGRALRGRAQKLAPGELSRMQVAAVPAAAGRSPLPQPPKLEMARLFPQTPAAAAVASPAAIPVANADPKPATAPAAKAAPMVIAQAPAPAVMPVQPPRQITVTREQVELALKAERERAQRVLAQKEATQKEATQKEATRKDAAQQEAQARHKAQQAKADAARLAKAQAARRAEALKLAQLQKERAQKALAQKEMAKKELAQKQQALRLAAAQQKEKDKAREQAQAKAKAQEHAKEQAQQQARHEAQVRRALELARADGQERDRQQRDAQEKLQAQREALQREQQLLADQRKREREQIERRLAQEAQQRQAPAFIVAPPQGIPVLRGSRS